MSHPPRQTLACLAVLTALIVTALAAATLAPVPLAAARPVSEPPGQITWGPGCPNPNPDHDLIGPITQWAGSDTTPAWSSYVGDYVGPDGDRLSGFYKGNCNGSTQYILDQAIQTAQFRWHLDLKDIYPHTFLGARSCHLWAYIPNQFAGDRHARYDFWSDDRHGRLTWLGWPGRAIDQETTPDGSTWVGPTLAATCSRSPHTSR